MQTAPIPSNEEERLNSVKSLHILDTKPEVRFDRITREAATNLRVPICTITIVDAKREWYKSCVGVVQPEGPRESSFCGHTVVSGNKILIIPDTLKDDRFRDNPQVTGKPHVRFYAGVTLHDRRTHLPVGAFCIKDNQPRELTVEEMDTLLDYANQAEYEINNGALDQEITYVKDSAPGLSST